MATVAAPRLRSRARPLDWPAAVVWGAGAALMVVLLAYSLWARTRALSGSFWMDEGLSVGIASHPLGSIPHVLIKDGSPPAYYLLLHVWMSAFGSTEARTHALSVVFAMLAVPFAWLGAKALFGTRAAWIAAFLAAFNPFLTAYGQETRMYAMLATESIAATPLLVMVFVHRRRAWIAPLAVLLALMLYTHGWAIFFSAACVVAVLALLRNTAPAERRPLLIDGLLVFGGAGILFLPWLPTLLEQTRHTAAPWSRPPRFGAPIQISRGVFGGDTAAATLLLAGGLGLVNMWRSGTARSRDAISMLLIVGVGTIALAWIESQVSPAWTTRYFGILLGPLLLLAAGGMARIGGYVLSAAIVLLVFFWFAPSHFDGNPKSDIRDVAAEMSPLLHPGDLVISGQPEQTPALAYYLGPQYRYSATDQYGIRTDPYVQDWRDAVARYKRVAPARAENELVATLRPGQHVLLVRPLTEGTDNWSEPWTKLVRRRSAQLGGLLAADKRLRRVAVSPQFYRNVSTVGNSAVLYVRTG